VPQFFTNHKSLNDEFAYDSHANERSSKTKRSPSFSSRHMQWSVLIDKTHTNKTYNHTTYDARCKSVQKTFIDIYSILL